ncbi:hypothetical protein Sango_0906600 [Sesamum angolense]|uniref:Uncharacterized protein n=1 Tax=Sesamum angolense TaxID=2727404 RepID=A0AAE2BXR7_9LAMI|nr:hypothetical protein Sango_0906600 [Sesamum angolense]
MSESEDVKFSLRVMMNKEENKVLYAEVGSSFADVLLSFLTLPLGTIVRLLVRQLCRRSTYCWKLKHSVSRLEVCVCALVSYKSIAFQLLRQCSSSYVPS